MSAVHLPLARIHKISDERTDGRTQPTLAVPDVIGASRNNYFLMIMHGCSVKDIFHQPGIFGIAGPTATLMVNIGGSALMGLLAGGLAAGLVLPEPLRLFIAVGFLGALTTFSSFAFDAGSLLQRQGSGMTLVYIGASVGLSLLGFAAAYLLAGSLFSRGAA